MEAEDRAALKDRKATCPAPLGIQPYANRFTTCAWREHVALCML